MPDEVRSRARLAAVACLFVSVTAIPWTALAGTGGAEPMFGSYGALWGKIGLEYRLRLEVRDNMDLDRSTDDLGFMGLQRARLQLSLDWSDWVEAFVQVQDSRTLGMGNSTIFYDGNTDLHQAWARFTISKIFTVKAGRQVLAYGDQRLIGGLEWSNVARSYDGLRLSLQYRFGTIDAFVSVFTPDRGGNLLDGTWLFGVYDTMRFLAGMIVWDQYVIGLFDTEGAMPPGTVYGPDVDVSTGPERGIVTIGTRLRLSGHGIDAGLEAAYQTGYQSVGYDRGDPTVDTNAFALHGDVKYTLPVLTGPFLRIEANIASGNGHDDDRHWKRFANLFPTNHMHYGYMDLMSWSNTVNGSLGAGLSPCKAVTLAVDWWVLARLSEEDGWFGAAEQSLAAPPDPAAPGLHDGDPMLGHEVDLTLVIRIGEHAQVSSGFGAFVPRGFGRSRGSDVQLWGFAMLNVTL